MPDTDTPVINCTLPDAPTELASAERTDRDPDPLDTLLPDVSDTDPPRPRTNAVPPLRISTPPTPSGPDALAAPAATRTEPLLTPPPIPTLTLIDPPAPPVALPVPTTSQPVLPDADAPVLSSNDPEVPLEPTSPDNTTTDPDPPLTLVPVLTRTAPPLPEPPALPPLKEIKPPAADVDRVAPPRTVTEPPIPEALLPTMTLIPPPLPPVADPLPIAIQPLFPDLDDPVLSVNVPDAPREAASAVATVNEPEPALTLEPLEITMLPPPIVD